MTNASGTAARSGPHRQVWPLDRIFVNPVGNSAARTDHVSVLSPCSPVQARADNALRKPKTYLGRVIHEIAAAMCCSDSWFKVFTTGQKRGVTS